MLSGNRITLKRAREEKATLAVREKPARECAANVDKTAKFGKTIRTIHAKEVVSQKTQYGNSNLECKDSNERKQSLLALCE
jgi:hypothetical protein